MKKCSVCGREFGEEKEYCDFCGIKLDEEESDEDELELEEEEEQEMEEETPPAEEESEGNVCPVCGSENPPGAEFCTSCGADMSKEIEGEERVLTLVLPGGKEISLEEDELIIGREDFEGLLPDEKLRYLSRRNDPDHPDKNHFKIITEDDEYFVIDENSTNNTWLKGEKIKGEGKKKLEDGDEIKAAGEIPITVRIW
ncbi:MAG: zinc ribbon domain-containing protein [Thermoplasmata archaeon]